MPFDAVNFIISGRPKNPWAGLRPICLGTSDHMRRGGEAHSETVNTKANPLFYDPIRNTNTVCYHD